MEGARHDGSDGRYDTAASLLSDWRASGALVASDGPRYYVYEFRFPLDGARRRLRGLVGALELEPWGGTVLPHEDTMPGPIEDRLQLLRATRTHLSPIYGTIAGPCDRLNELLDRTIGSAPIAIVYDEEGVEHRLWEIHGEEDVTSWLADEPLLIADGHHRYATALAYRDERRATEGPGPWDRILALVVDAATEQVPVLPYHRVQMDGEPPTGGQPADDLARAATEIAQQSLGVSLGSELEAQFNHGVEPRHVQTLIGGDFYFAGRIVEPVHSEPRWLALGEDATGRRLSLIFTRRGDRRRPISCRAMRRKEKALYEEACRQED